MNYKIIKTQSSTNERISYSLFTHQVEEGDLKADTYGIIAVDFNLRITIDDVTTDIKIAEHLLNDLADKSIAIDKLKEYIIDYLSKL